MVGEDSSAVGRFAWQMMKWRLQKDICHRGWPQQPEAVLIDWLSDAALRCGGGRWPTGLWKSSPHSRALVPSKKVTAVQILCLTFDLSPHLLLFCLCILFLFCFYFYFLPCIDKNSTETSLGRVFRCAVGAYLSNTEALHRCDH